MTFASNPKPSRTERKIATRKERLERRSNEEREKRKVRRRDKWCRFPLCGCRKLGLRLEVSHQQHKGAGGNPKGDRSTADQMILLCEHRHQHGAISRHKGTLRIVERTRDGMNGPVIFEVDVNRLTEDYGARPQRWRRVAWESRLGVLEPLDAWQRHILEQLAEMEL